MKLKYILSSMAVLMATTGALADTNRMIVNKTDNEKLIYMVSDVNSGSFDNNALSINGNKVADLSEISSITFQDLATLPFTITSPKGEITGYEAIPTMLRALPQAAGQPTDYAFGTVKVSNAAELPMGEYGVLLTLSPTAQNAGGVTDLSASTEEYNLRLYTYNDGQATDSLTTVTGGNITYSWNAARKRLVLNINATFKDGTVLKSEFTGTPTDVASMDGIVPAKKYGNEIVIIQPDGTSSRSIAIDYASLKTRNATGSNPRTLTFTFETSDWTYSDVTLEIVPDLIINKGNIDMATVTGNCYCFKAGSIQFYAVDAGRQSPLDGVMNISKTGDNDYEVFLQVTDLYNNPWGSGQTGSRQNITLHWKGTIE